MTPQDVIDRINAGYDAEPEKQARDYIGASAIGNQCEAYLAFHLRGFPNDRIEPRLKRLFALGHALEDKVIEDLVRKADIRVWAKDGVTGRQFAYEAWGGHISCHADGQIEIDGTLMLLEVKSMNKASFQKFVDTGMRRSHPHYHAQVQMMMGMSGFRQTFFIAYCKDDSAYHAEIVDYDPLEASFIEARVERVLSGSARRIAEDDTDWRCRGCSKRRVCWSGEAEVQTACQTCRFARPKESGEWHCTYHNAPASLPCEKWTLFTAMEKS
jgi:hypothetical protein